MDIETLAIAEIERRIARCPHLKSFIAKNDKTPLTDGHVDLFKQTPQRNSNWLGRVDVQVKGRSRPASQDDQRAYSIACADLRAFQSASGVLYFVGYVDPHTGDCDPYYALLSPFVIDAVLHKISDSQVSVSVRLRQVPSETERLEGLLHLALETKKQNPALGFDPVLANQIQGFTVTTAVPLDTGRPVTLDRNSMDYALVAHTAGGMSIPMPGEFALYPAEYGPQHTDVRVQAGSIVYEGGTITKLDDETHELKLANGLTLVFVGEAVPTIATVTLTLEQTLAGRLKALEFFTALQEIRQVCINESTVALDTLGSAVDTELSQHLAALRDLTVLFQHLGVDTGLVHLEQIDDAQSQQLSDLHRGFVLGEELHSADARPGRVLQKVGDWAILFLIKAGSSPQRWQVVDPFDPANRQQLVSMSDEEGAQPVVVTAYELVEDQYLPTVLNIRLDEIVPAYEAIAAAETTHNVANLRVVRLLRAADACSARQEEFLDAAERLNEWLIQAQGPDSYHLLNRWQILARRSDLPEEIRIEVRDLQREAARSGDKRSGQVELACALLLGDPEQVDYLTKFLPPEQFDEMRSWPIWTLRESAA